MNRWKAAIAKMNWRELPSRRQGCAFAGTACLVFGIWAPVMDALFFGEIAYAQFAQAEAWVILALAVMAVLAAAMQKFRLLWLAGAGALAALGATAWRMVAMVAEASAATQPLMQVWLQSLRAGWAWIPLGLGALLLLLAAAGPRFLATRNGAAQPPAEEPAPRTIW